MTLVWVSTQGCQLDIMKLSELKIHRIDPTHVCTEDAWNSLVKNTCNTENATNIAQTKTLHLLCCVMCELLLYRVNYIYQCIMVCLCIYT